MRGEHPSGDIFRKYADGIIPACAGNTLNDLRLHMQFSQFSFGSQDAQTPRKQPRRPYVPSNFFARWYLLALLQPLFGRPISVASSVPSGRLIKERPSQSTGSQSG